MIRSRSLTLLASLALGLFLAVAALALTARQPSVALAAPEAATTRFASPSGGGVACTQATPCALQTAVDRSVDGDFIYVAGGVYQSKATAVLTLNKTVQLQGGWSGAAFGLVVVNSSRWPSILDGQDARRAMVVTGDKSPGLRSFTFQHGRDAIKGGGVYVENGDVVISSSVFTDNFAGSYGGGLYVSTDAAARVSASQFVSNTVEFGGGAIESSMNAELSLTKNIFMSNSASYGSVLHSDRSVVTATANLLLNNLGEGRCLSFNGGSGARALLVNNVIAGNSGNAIGGNGALPLWLKHNTLSNNTGYAITTGSGSVLTMTNNILAGHTSSSLSLFETTLIADTNLFWNNSSDPETGLHPILADPLFVDDYHLGIGSPAVDAGLDAGVTTDMEGEKRPMGVKPDLGADESKVFMFLPMVTQE